MKALVYEGAKKAVLEEVEEPKKREGTVKLDIKYCGICGSDIGIYLGTHPRAKAPLVFGHEFLGIVAEDGQKFKKGDRVVPFPLLSCGQCRACRTGNEHVCNTLGLIGIDKDGGVCERIYVDEDVLYKVPDGVSDKAAAVIEPLAVIVRAIHQSGFKAMDTCVVIGAGPIGMLSRQESCRKKAVLYQGIDENGCGCKKRLDKDKAATVIEPLAVIVRTIHQSGFKTMDT